MRATVAVVVAVAVGCGGGAKKPPLVIANRAEARRPEPWSVARVLAALPPDTSVVMQVDTLAVRKSPILEPYWDQLSAWAASRSGSDCLGGGDLDATIVMTFGGTQPAPELGVWILDTSAAAVRTCLAKGSGRVTFDGDYAAIEATDGTGFTAGAVFLDDRTVFVRGVKGAPLDRAAVVAATAERGAALSAAELDRLFASGAPVWGFVAGGAPVFATSPLKFRTAMFTVGLTDRIDLDVEVRMLDPDTAASTAQTVQQQGQSVVQLGLVTELAATAEDDAVDVHVAFTKASLDKMVQLVGGALIPGLSPPPVTTVPIPPPPTP